jgi:hypothetical protein
MLIEHVRRDPGHSVCNVVLCGRGVVDTVFAAARRTPLQTRDLVHEARFVHEADRAAVQPRQQVDVQRRFRLFARRVGDPAFAELLSRPLARVAVAKVASARVFGKEP